MVQHCGTIGSDSDLRASEFPCEAIDVELYLLVPRTSDHLFNLEHDPSVTLLTAKWELKGEAHMISPNTPNLELGLISEPDAQWCGLGQVNPYQIQRCTASARCPLTAPP